MKKAFSLIELLVVIVLFSVLSVSVLWLFVTGVKTWGYSLDRAHLREDANLAMARMVRELTQANSITDADTDEITFLADLDDNGTDETMTFSVSGTDLKRTEGSVVTVLAANIQTLGLSYRDLDDNLLSLPADTSTQAKRDKIRIITVTLTMDKDDETITISSSVYARNQ